MKIIVLVLTFTLSLPVWSAGEIVLLRQNSEPKYMTAFPQQSGLCDLVYLELQKRLAQSNLNVIIDPTLYPVKRLLVILEQGTGHIFCGAGQNAERNEKFIYSKSPVYHVNNAVISHTDETYIPRSYSDLADPQITVGAFFGTSSSKFLATHKNLRLNENITTLDQALKAIEDKQIRYFYYHDLGLKYLVNETDKPIKLLPTVFRSVPQWILFSKKLPETQLKLVSASFEEIVKDGTLKGITRAFTIDE